MVIDSHCTQDRSMVIQLTKAELAILENAANGRPMTLRASTNPNLKLLVDMQMVICIDGRMQITLIGQHVLKLARKDPRRAE